MEEMVYLLHFGLRGGLVLGVSAAIPTCPDRRRIHIYDVFTKVAAPDRRHARRVEPMRLVVQLSHEGADLVLVEFGEVARPVILVAQTPNDHGRMVVVLVDHVAEHSPSLFLVVLASQTTAAPGNLFPDEQAELVAAVEHSAGLLIVAQPDEVRAHLLDQLHLGANQLFAHRRTEQGVVLVAMRSLDQKSRAIESERTVVDKFKRAQSKA